MNCNETGTYQNLRNIAKAVIRGKSIPLNVYMSKKVGLKSKNDSRFHLLKLRKGRKWKGNDNNDQEINKTENSQTT